MKINKSYNNLDPRIETKLLVMNVFFCFVVFVVCPTVRVIVSGYVVSDILLLCTTLSVCPTVFLICSKVTSERQQFCSHLLITHLILHLTVLLFVGSVIWSKLTSKLMQFCNYLLALLMSNFCLCCIIPSN